MNPSQTRITKKLAKNGAVCLAVIKRGFLSEALEQMV
jgi:hypothetical protein